MTCGDNETAGVEATSDRSRGFSMLEMLTVIAIIGVVLSFAAPSLLKTLDSATFVASASEVERKIVGLRIKALLQKRDIVFPGPTPSQYEEIEGVLPIGWVIDGDPVVFLRSGICLGGELTIKSDRERQRVIELRPPECSSSNLR